MIVLTVAGLKGGVGKSTTAIALAYELAASGLRVTLVDLDPQASATLALGGEVLTDPLPARPVAIRPKGGDVHFMLQAGGRTIANADARDLSEFMLRTADTANVIIVDTPPYMGAPTSVGLWNADVVLVPIEPTPMALSGLTDVAAVLGELKDPPELRTVLVRVQARRILSADVQELITQRFPGALCETQIPEDVKAAEAPGFGLPVGAYAPSSRATAAYADLAREITPSFVLVV